MKKLILIFLCLAVCSVFAGEKKNIKIDILRIQNDGDLALKCSNYGESGSEYYYVSRTSMDYDAVLMTSLYAYESDKADLYIHLKYDDNNSYITEFALHNDIWN